MTEIVIDRSLDQTAEHVHMRGKVCPTCGAGAGKIADEAGHFGTEAYGRRVSPAIMEFEVVELRRQNELLEKRIGELENLNARIATALDEANYHLEHFAGTDGPDQ